MFSRVASRLDAEINPLYKIRDELVSQEHAVLDLVSGNVNESGILYPPDVLEAALTRGARESRIYHPDSFGRRSAREAISEYYRSRGVEIPPEAMLLTPGTSIAYWYCFKLLANEGEEVLCPRPSYPLFEYIAALSGVRLVPYPLSEKRNWSIDLEALEHTVSTQTRAMVLISPHNPTGHVSSAAEIAALGEIADRHDLTIISDEVFCEFLLGSGSYARPAGGQAPLVITLNGFSKMLALPGMKLGWMGVSGQPGRVKEAMRALELISDTFLPVNEVVQAAAADILRNGAGFLQSYAAEIRDRWATTAGILENSPRVRFVRPEGGFYVALQLQNLSEESTVQKILRETRCLLHPGFFYEIDGDHLVLSFVQEKPVLTEALPRVLGMLDDLAAKANPKNIEDRKGE
jgi:alanine-synthesizing transaminase